MICPSCKNDNVKSTKSFPQKIILFDDDLIYLEINEYELNDETISSKINKLIANIVDEVSTNKYTIKKSINYSNSEIDVKIHSHCMACNCEWISFNFYFSSIHELLYENLVRIYKEKLIIYSSDLLQIDCRVIVNKFEFVEWDVVLLNVIKSKSKLCYIEVNTLKSNIDKIKRGGGDKGGGGGYFNINSDVIIPLAVGLLTSFIYDISKNGIEYSRKKIKSRKRKIELLELEINKIYESINEDSSRYDDYYFANVLTNMSERDRKSILRKIALTSMKMVEHDLLELTKNTTANT